MADQPSFARAVLSGPGGGGSTARVVTLLLVLFPLCWVSYLVFRKNEIPDLGGVTTFISATTLSSYGVNKFAGALGARKGQDS